MKNLLKHYHLSLLIAFGSVLIGNNTQQTQAQPCGSNPLVLSVDYTYTNCYSRATICATVSGGWSDIYHYLWRVSWASVNNVAISSETTFCIENLSPGATYHIGAHLPGGWCYTTQVVTIPYVSTAASISTVSPSACGANDGWAFIDNPVMGSVDIYEQYLWDNGATTSGLYNLAPGQYCVTATPMPDCGPPRVFCTTVGAPIPDATAQAATCGMCNGSIAIPYFNNYPIYDYDFSYSVHYYLTGEDTIEIQPGMVVQGLCPGTYMLIASDLLPNGNTCDTTLVVGEVELEALGNADFSTSVGSGAALAACTNQAVQFAANGIENISLSWNFGDPTAIDNESGLPNPIHTYPNAGTYTVTLIAQGCYSTDTMQSTFTISEGIVPDITCISLQCPGDTVTYATSAVCGNYQWSIDGATIIGPSNANTVAVVWDDAPQGSISLSISNCDSVVCNNTTTVAVPLLSNTATITGPAVVCGGETALYSLPAYGGVQYAWGIDPPNAGTIVSGTGTPQIVVLWSNGTDGTVRATWSSILLDCVPNVALPVQVNAPYDIDGIDNVCANNTYTYTASAGLHNWSVSGNGTIVSGGSSSNSATIMADASGSFTVSATPVSTDTYCSFPQSITANIMPQPAATALSGDTIICPNNSYQYSVNAPDPAYTYEWAVTGGNLAAGLGNSLWITWDNSGIYSVSVIARLKLSPYCALQMATLSVNAIDSISISGNASVCAGDKVNYTALPLLSNMDYAWTVTPPNAGSIVAGQGSNAVSVQWNSGVAAAVLNVSVCGVSDEQSVVIGTAIEPLIVASGNLCEGSSIDLSTNPSTYTDYIWSNGDNTASTTISSGDSYRVTVTDANNGCTANAQTDITVYPLPDASISAAQYPVICIENPNNITLHTLTHPDYTYQWYQNNMPLVGENATSITHIADTTIEMTTYYALITGQQGCEAVSNAIVVSQIDCIGPGGSGGGGGDGCMPNAGDVLDFQPLTPYCSEVAFQNLSNALSYTWNFGDGSPTVAAADNSVITHTYAEPGFYSVILAATFDNTLPNPPQCTYITARVVEIPLIADFRFEATCLGNSTAFFDLSRHTPTTDIVAWEWDFGDGFSSTDPNPSHIYAAAGTYSVSLTISSDNCVVTSTQDVTINPLPDANFALPTTLCQYGALAFTPNDQTEIDAYHWAFGDGANVSTALPEHSYTTAGNFTVSLSLTDFAGCSNNSSQNIEILPVNSGAISSSAATACAGMPITLTAPVGTAYAWSTGEDGASIDVSDSGVFEATVTQANGCSFEPEALTLNFSPIPSGTIYPNTPITLCPNESQQFSADIGSDYTYAWSNGSTTANINVGYDDVVAPLSLTVTITNSATGCSAVSNAVVVDRTIVDAPSIAPISPIHLCEGGSTILTASHPTLNNFAWNTGEVGNSITVSEQGVYIVKVTDANGCANSASVAVLVNSNLDMSVVPSGCYELCKRDTINIPPIFDNYQWLYEGEPIETTNGNLMTVDQSGDYQLVAYSTFGCADTSDVLSVSVTDCLPCEVAAGFSVSSTCHTFSFTKTTTSNGYAETTIDFGDGSPVAYFYGSTIQHVYDTIGSYNVCINVTNEAPDGDTCSSQYCQTINIDESNFLSLDADIYPPCSTPGGGYLDLTVIGGTPPYSFIWSNGETTEDIDLPISDLTILRSVLVMDQTGCQASYNTSLGAGGAINPPVLTCANTDLNSVTFTWAAVYYYLFGFNAIIATSDTTYTVTLNGSFTSYTVQDLPPGTEVTMILRALGAYPCGGSVADTLSCTTLCADLTAPNITCSEGANNLIFAWNNVSQAIGYEVTMLVNGLSTTDTTTETSYVIDNITPETTATLSVVALAPAGCANGAAATQMCTTACPALAAPVLDCGMPTENSITFAWTAIDGAQGYTINASINGIAQPPTTSMSSEYTLSGLAAGTEVVINVVALAPAGCANGAAATQMCTTACPALAAPILDCGMPTENSITFAWTAIDGAQGYTINTSINGIAQPPTTSMSSEYTLSGLAAGTEVVINVVALAPAGCANGAAATQMCTTACPALAVPILDCGMPTENSITFAWTPIDGAQGYTINTSINGIAQPPTTSMSSEYTLSGLAAGTEVVINVVALAPAGCANGAAATQMCTTDCPALASPILDCGTPTENSITFAWTPIDGAQGYTINASINGIAQPPTTSMSSEYTLSGLLPETLVEFSVTAFSSPNCPTSATAAQSCNTTAVPCALNPLQLGSLMTAFCLDDEPTDLDIQPIGGTWTGNGINGNAFDPMLAGAGLHEVTYSLTQIDGTTECVFDTTLTFSVSQVTINNTISDTTKLPPNINELTVTIDASSALGDMLVYTWLENGTTVLCSGLDCETFTLNPSETTTYSVIVTDEYGCEASITTVVELRQADMLLMPNAFSPNGDGINDLFKVSGLHIAEYHLRIYDRLSTMVYDSQLTQDLDTGWDGIYDGRPARLGVYVYHVLATFKDGSQCTIRGNVTLVR